MVAQGFKGRWVELMVLALSVFLVFCLIFESFIELPSIVGWMGRWHPLILHFPIVLLVIIVFLGFTGREIPKLLFQIAVITVLLTAISGFFLGKSTGEKGALLLWHQWLGASLALVAVLLYRFRAELQKSLILRKVCMGLILLLVGFTGHYGGMITHGEDFLALPGADGPRELPEDPQVYSDLVVPILEDKCMSCHNPDKRKGELSVKGFSSLMKGGESGNTVLPGNYEESTLITRLHLPLEDEEHMPPEGKSQLEVEEITILERWIALGASDTLQLSLLAPSEPLAGIIKKMMGAASSSDWSRLPMVADETIDQLSNDYLTITRMAGGSNALGIDAFPPPEYDSKPIQDLEAVAANIVELDLSGLPIGDNEMNMVEKCANLEWLELDRTPVTDQDFQKITGLKQLRLLKIYGTKISDRSISVIQGLENLKRLYIWSTEVSNEALEQLARQRPDIVIEKGIDDKIQNFLEAKDTVPNLEKKE
ncbi:hypothetical protein D1013_17760 [Euzebyella marina]|uniref:Cytochrome C Planctomycete-type domain-containing protein n=1 Tax=Euzebyella marina TaxID=1761453 RepID=A0A3G2LA57_9FLAO|nr:c-type cytochrome domain-containing protein [Euzebyella marina]AYN69093.1 hypothetical protein D1013_17760 [Euzebyella marina]